MICTKCRARPPSSSSIGLGGDENYKFVVSGDVDTAENDDDHEALRKKIKRKH